MAELISDNAEQRAFTAAAMNTLQCKLLVAHYTVYADYCEKIHSPLGYPWYGFNRFINLTVRLPLPFM